MLGNANYAPTHKMTEPWRFVVFCDEGIQVFANFQADKYLERMGEKADTQKETKLRTKPLSASHIIAIGMKRNEVVPEMEEIAGCGCRCSEYATNGGCIWDRLLLEYRRCYFL